ncbi:MAG: addiction module protein [Pyrinomonadaceae bacterium]
MSVVAEIEERAMSLGPKEKGQLITRLLRSLPEFTSDDDDGVAEALRRREELRRNPEIGISLDELDRRMKERFG